MLDQAEIGGLREGRRWTIASAEGGAGLRGLSIRLSEAGDGRQLEVQPGEVIGARTGRRTWRSAVANIGGEDCLDVVCQVRFLDGSGWLTGEVCVRSPRLHAGGRLRLEAPLPAAATHLQVHTVRWRTSGASVELGPSRPQPLSPLTGRPAP